MNAKHLARTWGAALLLATASGTGLARDPAPDGAAAQRTAPAVVIESTVLEDLATGAASDVYRVVCVAECISADVNDAGPFLDARFKVNVNGSSNAFVGSASAISPTGGTSLAAEVCSGQNVDATRRAFVAISEVNVAGAENYDTVIVCRRADGSFVNPTIVKILDQ